MHEFESRLASAWPPSAWKDVTVLVAVSGGPDSVALLRAMAAIKQGGAGRLVAGHLNHGLRGPESDADAAFVAELCRSLGIDCEIGRAELPAAGGHGLEATARRARYTFLEEAAGRYGARYVATAHTADDQAETILHRVLRGTGLRGLAGMARCRPLGPVTLLRPMMGFRRREVVAYLEVIGQSARHDSSNLSMQFTRNRLRHELLPLLAERYNAGVVDALLRLGGLAGENQAIVDRLVEELFERSVKVVDARTVGLDCPRLAAEPRYLVRELFSAVWQRQGWPMQAMGFAEWESLAEMAAEKTPDSKRMLPGNVHVARRGERVVARRKAM